MNSHNKNWLWYRLFFIKLPFKQSAQGVLHTMSGITGDWIPLRISKVYLVCIFLFLCWYKCMWQIQSIFYPDVYTVYHLPVLGIFTLVWWAGCTCRTELSMLSLCEVFMRKSCVCSFCFSSRCRSKASFCCCFSSWKTEAQLTHTCTQSEYKIKQSRGYQMCPLF